MPDSWDGFISWSGFIEPQERFTVDNEERIQKILQRDQLHARLEYSLNQLKNSTPEMQTFWRTQVALDRQAIYNHHQQTLTEYIRGDA